MWLKIKQFLDYLPPMVLGLFASRVVSEQWAVHYGSSWITAFLLVLVLCSITVFTLQHHPLRQTWPLLLLLGYVFYPHPNSAVAVAFVLLVTAVLAQRIPLPTDYLSARHLLIISFLGSALFFALLYIFSLAPGLLPADSGEFQLVGATLGVAHPPGFPLYTLLSKLMTWLPLAATAAYKINLLSAFSSAATLGIVYLIVFRLTARHLAAGTAVIALGTATTFWAQATTANIRSLTALFAALAIFALVRHWQEKAHTDRYLVLFAAALSFGFTHHLSLAFMGLVFGLSLILLDPQFFKTPSRWRRPFLAALLGLLPLIYLPLRAGANVPGARESLDTISGFLNHFLALGFQGDFFYFVQPVVLWERLKVMGNVFTFQFSPWLLAGALLGWVWLLRRNWRLGLLLGGSFALHTLVTATYRAPQTVEYMLPAYLPVAICLGVASGYLSEFGLKQQPWLRWLPLTLTAALFAVAVGQGWQRWPSFRYLHQVADARDYAQTILEEAPADSLILANWHWVTPLWYLQTVEGQRPDVTIEYVAPGGEPYSQTWAKRIAKEWANDRLVIATYYDEAILNSLPTAEPLGEALLFPQMPRTDLPTDFEPLALAFKDAQIVGYRLEQPSGELGQTARLTVAWQASQVTSLFVHLLDESGNIIAQDDVQATPQPNGLTLTQFRLTPRQGSGRFTLRLGSGAEFAEIGTMSVSLAAFPSVTQHPVYRPLAGEQSSTTLIGYDWDNSLPGQTRLYLHWKNEAGYWYTNHDNPSDIELANLLPSTHGSWGLPSNWSVPPPMPNSHYVPLGQGIVWLGESLNDWQTAVSPGNEYALPMQFAGGRPLLRDYVVSTRIVGFEANGFTWAWCDLIDGVPAMGGIPTLKWIAGSQVQSLRSLRFPPRTEPASFSDFCQSVKPAPDAPIHFVDSVAIPGQTVGGILRLYDAFTNRPLPILDERITAAYSWIPLGETIIEE